MPWVKIKHGKLSVNKRREPYRLLIALVIILIALGLVVIYMWNRPLGPTLQLPTRTSAESSPPSALDQPGEVVVEVADNVAPQPAATSETQSSTQLIPKSETMCGGPEVMTILLIGSDYRGEGYLYGLADAIRVVRIDFTTPAVAVLDFPRDLWVEIPGLSDHYNLTHGKLNQAYFFGTPGMGYYDGPGEGAGLLARTIDLNFNLPVDHYLTLQMKTLSEAVDAVGGVDITFDSAVDLNAVVGPTYPELLFDPGTYHFDGELAVHLVTSRKPSTFQRTRYQNMLIFALRDKLLSPEMRLKIPGLVLDFIGDTQTDLSPNDINKLICIAQAITRENIHIASFPEELFTAGRRYDTYRGVNTFVEEADFEVLRAYAAQFLDGTWPAP